MAARIGSAAFLLPAARTRAVERSPALDHEGLHQRGERVVLMRRGYRSRRGADTRARLGDADAHTKSESLLRHALAVEASARWYARHFGEDEELWGGAALLHDFDYEIHPTLDKHPQDGAPILREEGYPEELIEAVLSHAEHLACRATRR